MTLWPVLRQIGHGCGEFLVEVLREFLYQFGRRPVIGCLIVPRLARMEQRGIAIDRQILSRLEKLQPATMRTRLQDLGLHQRIGVVQEAEGNNTAAMKEYTDALAIAHQLAVAMGAELSLRNRAEGGLEAKLALPLHSGGN